MVDRSVSLVQYSGSLTLGNRYTQHPIKSNLQPYLPDLVLRIRSNLDPRLPAVLVRDLRERPSTAAAVECWRAEWEAGRLERTG